MCVEEMTRLCLHKLLYLGDDAQICVCPINGQYVGLQRVCVQQVCFMCALSLWKHSLLFFSAEIWGDATEAGDVISKLWTSNVQTHEVSHVANPQRM